MLVFYTPEVPQLKPLTNKSWKPLLSFGESSGGELLNFQGNYLHLDSSDPKKIRNPSKTPASLSYVTNEQFARKHTTTLKVSQPIDIQKMYAELS